MLIQKCTTELQLYLVSDGSYPRGRQGYCIQALQKESRSAKKDPL